MMMLMSKMMMMMMMICGRTGPNNLRTHTTLSLLCLSPQFLLCFLLVNIGKQTYIHSYIPFLFPS
jgi:hypothetical protein